MNRDERVFAGIDEHIVNVREWLSNMSAYELRPYMAGCGFWVAGVCGKHYNIGTGDYNRLFEGLMNVLSEFKEIALKGVKSFECEIIYKGAKTREFTFSCTLEETTEQECARRLKHKKYYNLDNGREIKNPVIVSLSIKQSFIN